VGRHIVDSRNIHALACDIQAATTNFKPVNISFFLYNRNNFDKKNKEISTSQ